MVQRVATSLQLPERSVRHTLELLAEGATIPFIARYRKELTGSLDELQIAEIERAGRQLAELQKRKETVLNTIAEQGQLTPELRTRIENCWDPTELEDLYLPFKPKRKTRASIAREKGLEPLAEKLFAQGRENPEVLARSFLGEAVPTVEEALQGARDIIAEWLNEDLRLRQAVRRAFRRGALVRSRVARGKEEAAAKFKDYFDFEEPLKRCPSHRLLAVFRGENEGLLRLSIAPEAGEVLPVLERQVLRGAGPCTEQVRQALHDAYKRLLAPSIETEFRQEAKERADTEAIEVFSKNLRQLLLAPPLGPRRILAIDPGYRTGCKVVALDEQGSLLAHTAIFPHPPQNARAESEALLLDWVERYGAEAIAVGNGTAGRETLALCRSLPFPRPVEVFLVNEAGASVYSASAVAREELPDHDVTVRGAVSIGRRLLDPLAELVKIDPKSIGVGQYQHDVNQTRLREALDRVVESCVNAVGVNLNTASKHLLTYVSGLGPTLAGNIVAYRRENGPFRSRLDLKKVPRLGEKAFEQCAGFLRIRNAPNPLDDTAVHPESYSLVERMAADLGVGVRQLIENSDIRARIDLQKYLSERVGLPTLNDILRELEKPGLDPRGQARAFRFAEGIHALEDL
ncbi:MAG: RNA-binding transcriptional accessory protein, partial [Bacteroidetes bacterium]